MNLSAALILKLVDGVTAPARGISGALHRLSGQMTALGMNGVLANAGRQMHALQRNMAAISSTVSTPLALLGVIGAKTAFEFEKAGNLLEALGDATGEQRAEFEKFANVLNAKYPQSLTGIIKTGTELLKAGLDFKQMLGALDPTLATAILGDMQPNEVATMLSGALNSFQMAKETTEQAMKSVTTVSDRMTYAAVKSTATLRDMGDMFRYVGAAAAASGTSLDEVTALAMAFSANKINGSEAGIALRSAIVRMVKMPKPGLKALSRIGLNLNDYFQGKQQITSDRILKGLEVGGIDAAPIKKQIDALVADPALQNAPLKLAAKVTAAVQEMLKSTGSAMDADLIAENVQDSIIAAGNKIDLMRFLEDLKQKMASGVATMGDIASIFEGRHFSRMQALLQANLKDILADIEKNAAGYTADRYKTVLKGIVGPVYELSAALEKLATTLGRLAFPEAAKAIKSLADALQDLSENNPTLLKFSLWAAGALVVLGPLGLLLGGLAAGLKAVVAALALLSGPVGWVAAFAAAVYAAYQNWDWLKSRIMESLNIDLTGTGAKILTTLWDGMKSVASKMLEWLKSIGAAIRGALDAGRAPIPAPDVPEFQPMSGRGPMFTPPEARNARLDQAGRESGRAFYDAFQAEIARAEAYAATAAGRMRAALSFTSSPTVTPRIEHPIGADSTTRSTSARLRGGFHDYAPA